MHFLGRVVSFALFIIFFSFLVLLIVLDAYDIPIELKEVLGGGGLFSSLLHPCA